MSWIDWLIVFVLNGSVIAYGLVLARGAKTSQDWFLGKRSLAWWAIGLSMFATNVDNADLVSLTGTTYNEGLHIIMVHTLGSLLGASFAAFFLVPAMARAGQFTNAEYLEGRFGPVARVLSALIQIQYRSSMLGLMIWSLYLLLTGFLGLSDPVSWILIVAVVVLAAIYTSLGGLKSVVMTDAFQGMIMIVAVAVIFSAVWNAAGGWSQMQQTLEGIRITPTKPAADLRFMGRYRGDDGEHLAHRSCDRLDHHRSGLLECEPQPDHAAGGSPVALGHENGGALRSHDQHADHGRAARRSVYSVARCFRTLQSPDQLYPHMADLYLGVGLEGFGGRGDLGRGDQHL